MNYLEIFGFGTGLVCVYFNTKQNVWGWPVAMVSVLVYAYIFYQSKLYADMGLQVFFFVLCGYGLYEWLAKDSSNQSLKATWSSLFLNSLAAASTLSLTGLIYFILTRYTDSDLPFLDALTTAMSIVAQFLLARKKIENWLYWIMADVIYVGIYFYKGLLLTSALYFIYIFLAMYGLWEWLKWHNQQKSTIQI